MVVVVVLLPFPREEEEEEGGGGGETEEEEERVVSPLRLRPRADVVGIFVESCAFGQTQKLP